MSRKNIIGINKIVMERIISERIEIKLEIIRNLIRKIIEKTNDVTVLVIHRNSIVSSIRRIGKRQSAFTRTSHIDGMINKRRTGHANGRPCLIINGKHI